MSAQPAVPKANLAYYIFKGVVVGDAGGRQFHLLALSGEQVSVNGIVIFGGGMKGVRSRAPDATPGLVQNVFGARALEPRLAPA